MTKQEKLEKKVADTKAASVAVDKVADSYSYIVPWLRFSCSLFYSTHIEVSNGNHRYL
jgi:hypothetical protein